MTELRNATKTIENAKVACFEVGYVDLATGKRDTWPVWIPKSQFRIVADTVKVSNWMVDHIEREIAHESGARLCQLELGDK